MAAKKPSVDHEASESTNKHEIRESYSHDQQHAIAMAQYYEARMRDHAAAYASAAAGAAWAAARIAACSYEQRPGKRHQGIHKQQILLESSPAIAIEQSSHEKRGRRRQRDPDWAGRRAYPYNTASTSSDDSRRISSSSKRGKTDSSLLGKTGVSVLHEWCDKRRKEPKFNSTAVDSDFEFTVTVEGKEWGQGKGTTKAAAKQDAARRALQALLPGVVFDTNGIVVEIPFNQAIADLAPNLARRLSIGVPDNNTTSEDDTKRRRKQYEIYSTTTSEDDDANSYYACRGASVCSALLHAMWQINDLIPEPPSFDFEISPNPAQLKRKTTVGSSDPIYRSSFKCTARLQLKRDQVKDNEHNDEKNETMTAVGTGATKREARHVASAQLLAMLFPDCNGMVEVKAAAEAAREDHAAHKAVKQQHKRHASFTQFRRGRQCMDETTSPKATSTLMGMPMSWDPPLPKSLSSYLCTTLGLDIPLVEDDLVDINVGALSISEKPTESRKEMIMSPQIHRREVSHQPNLRQQQLGDVVEYALQLQAVFEDGINDDVGRTVLRLGEDSDLKWIYKLLGNSETNKIPFIGRPGNKERASVGLPGPFSLLQLRPADNTTSTDDGVSKSNVSSRLWGPVTIILLLCRAIAPLDEPPLGCSILTVGFSMTKGKTLRIAEIGFEPHLPRERFIECLENFAVNMKCTLVVTNELKGGKAQNKVPASTEICLMSHELRQIVEHHVQGSPVKTNRGDTTEDDDVAKLEPGAPLQSVQEETEFDEDKEKVEDPLLRSEKQDTKPSKRSRVS